MSVAVGAERSQEGDASDENDDAEFFDAMEDSPAFITVTASGNIQHKWDIISIQSNESCVPDQSQAQLPFELV